MTESADSGQEELGPAISTFLGAVRIQFLLAVLSGALLSFRYTDQLSNAHHSVVLMHEGLLRPIQGLHYWGSAVLIVESLFLLGWMLWTGRYTRPFGPTFHAVLLLLVSSVVFQVTGNLMPLDRHGVETVVVETGITARFPVVGTAVQRILLQGPEVGQATLRLWTLMHIGTGLLVLAALVLGLTGRRRLRADKTNRTILLAITAVPLILAFAVASPLGTAAGEADASAFGAKVSWYTWPLHGAMMMFEKLHAGSGWIGAMLVPGVLLLGAFVLPLFGSRVPVAVARAGLGVVTVFFAGAALFFGGSFAPVVGTRDPAPLSSKSAGAFSPIDKVLAAQGAKLFNSVGCSDCHGNSGDRGGAGPSLKTEGLRHPDRSFYLRYVRKPTSVDPQSTMPAFWNLSDADLSSIAEFLRAKGR
jgi:mono/diheme cytochrome c family protein